MYCWYYPRLGNGQQRFLKVMSLANELVPSRGNEAVAMGQVMHEVGRQR